MTALDLLVRPDLVSQAWDYFRQVQTKDQKYEPLIGPADRPDTSLNVKTMEQYQKSPQFVKDCQLSDTRSLPNGFAFAMQCKGTKTILTFRFGKDMVSSTIENLIEKMPKYSSSILTMMRRVGECPDQQPGRAL